MATTTDTATATGLDTDTSETISQRSIHIEAKRSTTVSTVSTVSSAPPATKRPTRVYKKYKHVSAIHSTPRASCLSEDGQAPSFIGFRNLAFIVLVVGNLRLMIENFNKYGVLICIRCGNVSRQDITLGIVLYFLIPCHLLAAYIIELSASQHAKASLRQKRDGTSTPTEGERKKFQSLWKLIAFAHGINATLCLLITSVIVYFYIHHPIIGFVSTLHSVIVWLKTASYAFTNRDLRHAYLHPSKREQDALPAIYKSCPYPENITLSNLCYAWLAPTLIYQPVYPRTDKIRPIFILKRLSEVLLLTVFMWVVSAQYAAPVLRNSVHGMASMDLVSVLERLMKLSTISLITWLAGFFALFQSFLNALAEIMKFGDREFYTDWWNAPSVGEYWRRWNTPVFHFMKRHVYIPLIGRGWSPGNASIAVFVFSGFLHELLVGIPCHNILGVAFLGMVGQLPLIAITQPLERMNGHYGKLIGNTIFWVSFVIFGQPLCAMTYFYSWRVKFGAD